MDKAWQAIETIGDSIRENDAKNQGILQPKLVKSYAMDTLFPKVRDNRKSSIDKT